MKNVGMIKGVQLQMKNNMFKKMVSAMVLAMSLVSGAAFAASSDVQPYGENKDYQAAIVDSVPAAMAQGPAVHGYSENGDYQAAVVGYVPTAAVQGPQSHGYSENGDYTAAPAWDND